MCSSRLRPSRKSLLEKCTAEIPSIQLGRWKFPLFTSSESNDSVLLFKGLIVTRTLSSVPELVRNQSYITSFTSVDRCCVLLSCRNPYYYHCPTFQRALGNFPPQLEQSVLFLVRNHLCRGRFEDLLNDVSLFMKVGSL